MQERRVEWSETVVCHRLDPFSPGAGRPERASETVLRTRRSPEQTAGRPGRSVPKGNNVVAGNDSGNVSWFRFFPATRTIKAGQSVHFSIASKSEIHTMTFGPQPSADLVMVQPQPSGPPRLQFNPFMFLPSDPVLPPYTASNHGNGFLNTGIMDTNPQSPPPSSVDVTFPTAGTFRYECTIHPGMEGTIKVE